MSHPKHEVAEVIDRFGKRFIKKHQPNGYQFRVLGALSKCRTSALGGHKYRCDHCGNDQICYNSCRNRHCPKCQGSNQAYPVSHYHMVFTVPEALHGICILNEKEKMLIKPAETTTERIAHLTGIDVRQCPCCKVDHLVPDATVPRIRPPPTVLVLSVTN